jgi:2-dehydropantoate 2-reductase
MGDERSVLIFGAGSVGGYLGGKLAAVTSWHVTLLGRHALVDAVTARGLVVREHGAELISHPEAKANLDAGARYDLVMLTVRTYDVAGVMPELEAAMGPSGLLLAMQNGVGSEETAAERLGRDRVIAGTLTVRPGMDQPGVITRYSQSGGVALATMTGTSPPTWIVDAFRATGLPTVVVDDYRSLRWSKLLLNMLGAATTAILDIDVRELVSDPQLFRLEQLAFREAGRVMDAQGIKTVALPGYPVPLGRAVMRLPRSLAQRLIGPRMARARGGHSPGMRADLKRGKTEIDSYNGEIARVAQALGVPAPVNTVLNSLTHELVEHPDRRDAFRGNKQQFMAHLSAHGIQV